MIYSKFNDELQILEVFYEGEITLNDLAEYGNNVCLDTSLPRNLRILTDATKASYNKLDPGQIPAVIELTKENIKPFQRVKAAFIQSKPIETALSHLLELEFDSDKYHHSVFSTRKAALDWLLT
jgi:hypothetical protein